MELENIKHIRKYAVLKTQCWTRGFSQSVKSPVVCQYVLQQIQDVSTIYIKSWFLKWEDFVLTSNDWTFCKRKNIRNHVCRQNGRDVCKIFQYFGLIAI